MTLQVERADGEIAVTVQLINFGAGHHVPTDHPGRHLILVVSARDEGGQALTQTAGPVVPGWGGAQAGLPGNVFAKVLQDIATADYPVTSYWKRTRIVVDNRIPALGTATNQFRFTAPAQSRGITVTAELLFRRTFQAEMDARRWDTPDTPMEWEQVMIFIHKAYLPLIQ
jgi:hypothetical protein